LKDIFSEAKLEDLLEFVAKVPLMGIEELVENYLTL